MILMVVCYYIVMLMIE